MHPPGCPHRPWSRHLLLRAPCLLHAFFPNSRCPPSLGGTACTQKQPNSPSTLSFQQ
ncbi:hypothetical protein KC19_VG140900 [Ceratodon purpureus]|uniref:Uncharacterized protein n=1 Tax=Ceratodon purpureus TaxID=3225 RepID=A0A8T0HR28_CERPU|nr:hypothetical protein KC19_VG140900 [Ceratodon purpureus]